jgi:hypothetical protein
VAPSDGSADELVNHGMKTANDPGKQPTSEGEHGQHPDVRAGTA